MSSRTELFKSYCVIERRKKPDGSWAEIRSKKGSTYSISTRARIYGTIYVGNNVIIEDATIFPNTMIGDGTVIKAMATIGRWTTIRSNCVVACFAVVGNYCYLGPKCSIARMSVINDHIKLDRETEIPPQSLVFIDNNNVVKIKDRFIL